MLAGAALILSLLASSLARAGDAGLGLCAALGSAESPAWPVELSGGAAACEANASWAGVERALLAAGRFMAAFPGEELHFDAAIGLHEIRRAVDSPALRRAWESALERARRDADHPHHRLLDSSFLAPVSATRGWSVPADGKRVNPNRVIDEVLHCDRNGLRRETLTYMAGPMRDAGGYHSCHALWGFALARERGCLEGDAHAGSVRALQQELVEAQPERLEPRRTLDIDLYAERLLMLLVSAHPGREQKAWISRLLELQGSDGSWGIPNPEERAYFRYHATLVSSWALAVWVRRQAAR